MNVGPTRTKSPPSLPVERGADVGEVVRSHVDQLDHKIAITRWWYRNHDRFGPQISERRRVERVVVRAHHHVVVGIEQLTAVQILVEPGELWRFLPDAHPEDRLVVLHDGETVNVRLFRQCSRVFH